jgi:hypothetical protein
MIISINFLQNSGVLNLIFLQNTIKRQEIVIMTPNKTKPYDKFYTSKMQDTKCLFNIIIHFISV